MKCHEVDYELIGDDIQIVEVELDPGETVIAEAGAMNYMEDGISYEARMGDGSSADEGIMGKLLNVGKRVLTGESILLTHFTNQGQSKKRVAFAAPYPGKIIPLDITKVGGEILCQKDAFLAAALGTEVGIAFNKRLGAGFFGGEGFILQRLRGDGMAFLHVGGTVIQKKLNNDTLRVDTGCLVAFTKGLEMIYIYFTEFQVGLSVLLGEPGYLGSRAGPVRIIIDSIKRQTSVIGKESNTGAIPMADLFKPLLP